MPSRWWVSIADVRPDEVRLEHIHAAFSGWFDRTPQEHSTGTKPYALSPLARRDNGTVGLDISVLTDLAHERLQERCHAGAKIRLGRLVTTVVPPQLLAEEDWDSLAKPTGNRSWDMDFVTPATFRRGDRCSPLPVAASALRGLQDSWRVSGETEPRDLTPQQSDQVWVDSIDGHSEHFTLSGLKISGFVGRVRFRCADQAVADLVDALFRLAPYSGVGSFKAKGLGVAQLRQRMSKRPASAPGAH